MQRFIFISILLFLVLGLRFFLFSQDYSSYKDGQSLMFTTRLTEEPQEKFGKQQFRVRTPRGDKITIITGLNPLYQYGDKIKISGSVSQKDYKGHTFSSMKNPTLQIDNTDQNFISQAATIIRRRASTLYQNNLPPVSASLLTGIVFGGNQGLPDKFVQQLRSSGVVHVIAASGMNVTFVAGALIGILSAIFKRQTALTIAILGIVFYAFLAGFEPSIVRAAIMAILAFSANLLGKQNLALLSIFLTGYIMLMLSPILISDVGFQLSFLATLGILLIKPLLPFGKNVFLLDDLGTTIAAQIATVPILLSVFGSYGILSIVVNGIVLWTVPVLMILGSLGLLFGMIFAPLGKIFLFLSEPILFFFERTVAYFGNLGWTLTIPSVSPTVWVGYYFLLGAIIILFQKRKQKVENKFSP